MMSNHSTEFWLRIVVVVFLAAIIFMVPAILLPFGISLILSILLAPLAERLQWFMNRAGWKKMSEDFSIIFSFLLFLGVLYLLFVHILVPFTTEARLFIASLPETVAEIKALVPKLVETYNLQYMPPEARAMVEKVVNEIGAYTLRVASISLSAIFSFASTMIELIVVPFITFYMIKKGNAFKKGFVELFPVQYRTHLNMLLDEIHHVLTAYVRGQLSLCVLMSCVTFVGMWFLGIPYPLVIGLLAGVVEMIPVLGPIIGAIPPVFLGLLESTGLMVKVILFYIVVQQLDSHLVMPKLMGSVIKVHPVAIIACVLIGGHLYGIVGMMIAVPVLSVVQVLIRHMWFYDYYRVIR
jgi:predicted PurR-regulated permease PerM